MMAPQHKHSKGQGMKSLRSKALMASCDVECLSLTVVEMQARTTRYRQR